MEISFFALTCNAVKYAQTNFANFNWFYPDFDQSKIISLCMFIKQIFYLDHIFRFHFSKVVSRQRFCPANYSVSFCLVSYLMVFCLTKH